MKELLLRALDGPLRAMELLVATRGPVQAACPACGRLGPNRAPASGSRQIRWAKPSIRNPAW